jgi:predicted SnoaL-like aldol condensation-catalyzing enzyme
MKTFLRAVGLAALLSVCAISASAGGRSSTSARAVVLAFYRLALQEMKPEEAFKRYGAPGFIEHSQDSAGGDAQATVVFLRRLISSAPHPKWQVIRTVAEGNMVFVHARYTAAPGAPEIAVAEIFRVQDGKIAEHWDVIGGPPDKVTNSNSRF